MTTIHVRWVSLHTDRGIIARGYWDQGMIENALAGRYYGHPAAPTVEHLEVTGDEPTPAKIGVWIIPGMHHADDTERLNALLAVDDTVIVLVTGDEEQIFPIGRLKHPDMTLWRMTPWATQPVAVQPLHDGPKADTWKILGEISTDFPEKDIPIHFRGQVNHQRRRDCMAAVRRYDGAVVEGTPGFTQGIERAAYLTEMARAQVVACPAGVSMPSSFRVFEALEAGCIPVVDTRNPRGDRMADYWRLDGFAPLDLPMVSEWSDLPRAMHYLKNVDVSAARLQGQWFQYRRSMAADILNSATEPDAVSEGITVVITTSPSPLHPDTSILEETIDSVRAHLPDAWVVIAADGLRVEQERFATPYAQYLRRVAWKANNVWDRVHLHYTGEWLHQAGTTADAIRSCVDTPLILFMEHDTPFNDRDIDWDLSTRLVQSGALDVLRFHHEDSIPPDHEHMMIGDRVPEYLPMGVLPTVQWSQRPHLARTDWYSEMLGRHFTGWGRTMIEDVMHGVAHNAWERMGLTGWANYKIGIYAPADGHLRRTLHTDGRRDEPKFEMRP